MEIDFSKGALQERLAINLILNSLWDNPQLCPDNSTTNSTDYALTQVQARNLMGNVTVSLFASMGITPTKGDLSRFGSSTLLMMYVNLLGFVYMYYFVTVALSMGYFAAFVHLTKRHPRPLHNGIAIGVRVLLGLFLLALVSFSRNFDLTYFFMTSPIIIFTFALALFKGEFSPYRPGPYSSSCSSPCRSTAGLDCDPEKWRYRSTWQQEQYSTDCSRAVRNGRRCFRRESR